MKVDVCESLDRIHAKYYGKGKVKAQGLSPKDAGAIINKKSDAPAEQSPVVAPETLSRTQLMILAKHDGVKYFRVMNKEELVKVHKLQHSGEAPAYIDEEIEKIQKTANARWKSGWGKKGKHAIA